MSDDLAEKYHKKEFSLNVDIALQDYAVFIKEGYVTKEDFPYAPYIHDVHGLPMDFFEYWQQFIGLDPTSIKWKRGHVQALALYLNGIWALNRFTKHRTQEWSDLIHEYIPCKIRIESEIEILDRLQNNLVDYG
jgi:hypothetical protein